MTWIKYAIVLLSLLSTAVPAHSQVTRPAQIILIRHGEKPSNPDNPHLSPAGVKRARELVSFIASDPATSRFGAPVAVFATKSTKQGNGIRTQETVEPLARALKVSVQTPFLAKDYAALARMVLANPKYAGKTVLICWNHEEITNLAAALGVKPEPPKWKASVFDRVYVISYDKAKVALATSRYGAK